MEKIVPSISVIVPVYNTASFLGRCIDSIISQTFTDFELILVDDGSKDNSYEICKMYTKRDKRLRVIHQDNCGVSAARNRGIIESVGRYITFIDSDDWVAPNYLNRLYYSLINNNADISVINEKNVCSLEEAVPTENGQIHIRSGKEMVERTTLLWSGKSCYSVCKLIKREIVEKWSFPIGRAFAEDHACVYHWYWEADTVVDLDDVLYYYFQRDESATKRSINPASFSTFDTFREKMQFFYDNKKEILYKWTMAMYFKHLGYIYRKVNENGEKKLQKLLENEFRKCSLFVQGRYDLNDNDLEKLYGDLMIWTQNRLIETDWQLASEFVKNLLWELSNELSHFSRKDSIYRCKSKNIKKCLKNSRRKMKKRIDAYPWAYNAVYPFGSKLYWKYRILRSYCQSMGED